ncbi:MAG TPA: glutathione peroxidase [Steroidobacteraceae bacterium]|jgi:glutaredoxin-like protein
MPPSREGTSVPNTTFKVLRNGAVQTVGYDDIFKGRRVVLFALPGAYTPTCSTGHVPRFVELAAELRKHGIDDIICLSVNDPFVMDAWQRDQKAESLSFLPDSDGAFSEGMGMLVDKSKAGLGKRSWRYSMIVNDGRIEKMFIEPDEAAFGVSDGDTALRYVDPSRTLGNVTMFARHGCPFCERAKSLLTERGIPFEVIYLGEGVTMNSVRAASGAAKVPQVFIEGKLIGGSDALQAFLDKKS